jgi:hypothetical protein
MTVPDGTAALAKSDTPLFPSVLEVILRLCVPIRTVAVSRAFVELPNDTISGPRLAASKLGLTSKLVLVGPVIAIREIALCVALRFVAMRAIAGCVLAVVVLLTILAVAVWVSVRLAAILDTAG